MNTSHSHSSHPMYTPAWVKDAIFYQIFPDRFAKSNKVSKLARLEAWDSPPTIHGYKGGDLYGVIEKLDYLQDLGINALYFNPIFQSASNHRYHTHDYFKVDPMLGGNEALRALIDACHARNIHVVLDGVFNHASRGFFQFNDILENKEHSPYRDWFHVYKFPLNAYNEHDLGYDAWWGLAALPKFNTANPEVRAFLFEVAEYWLKFGIDGWRLDVPNEIRDDAFWQEFRERCRTINPECYIVGEIWDDPSHWLHGDQFDAVMNYEFTRAIFGFSGAASLNHEQISKCGYQHIPVLDARAFSAAIERLLYKQRPEVVATQLNLLGSHDTPRALSILGNDEDALRMSYLFQMTFSGAPSIYYGDELALTGNHDPECRQAMPWARPHIWNDDFLTYIKQLIRLRHAHSALRTGSYSELYAQEGLYMYARHNQEESFVMLLNTLTHSHNLQGVHLNSDTMPKNLLHKSYKDVFSDLTLTLGQNDLELTGEVQARSAYIFKVL